MPSTNDNNNTNMFFNFPLAANIVQSKDEIVEYIINILKTSLEYLFRGLPCPKLFSLDLTFFTFKIQAK